MAFVNKSNKVSIFDEPSLAFTKAHSDASQLNDTEMIEDKQNRIHHQMDASFRKYLQKGAKTCHKQKIIPPQCIQQLLKIQTTGYDDKKMEKTKMENNRERKKTQKLKMRVPLQKYEPNYIPQCEKIHQKNKHIRQKLKQNHKNCDVNKNKTATTKSESNKVGQNVPGPGFYHPEQPYRSLKGVKISPLNNVCKNLLKAAGIDQEIQQKEEEKLFSVKYSKMSSYFFKKTSNMVGYSNKQLLNKLFRKGRKQERHKSLDEDDEYQKIQNRSPSPGSYHINKVQNNDQIMGKRSPFNTNSSRFPNVVASYCPISYQNTNIEARNNEIIAFKSKVQRFTDHKILNHRLQYQSTLDSHLKPSLNYKLSKFPFNSGLSRSKQMKQDLRQFHASPQMTFKGPQWTHPHEQKLVKLFQNINDSPGPGQYESIPFKKGKQVSFGKADKKSIFTKEQTHNNPNQISLKMGLGDLKKYQSQNLIPKGTKIHKKTPKKIGRDKSRQKYLDAVYEIPMEWQKKSYNKLFTKDILSGSNNPLLKQF